MGASDLIRVTTNSAAAAVALPAIVPAAIPSWGPPAIALFGLNIPVASTVLAMFGLAMARGVSSARDGPSPGGRYLTGVLVAILFGLVVERQPGPGVAIAMGIGVGASGIVLYDLMRDHVIAMFQRKKDLPPPQ